MGFTPLHYAVLIQNYRIIKLLIEHGANPSLVNNLMHTPIDYATDDLMRKFLTDCEAKVIFFKKILNWRNEFSISVWVFFFVVKSQKSKIKYIFKYKVLEKERELEKRRKFPIEQRLKQYIVGQEGAISIVSSSNFLEISLGK